VAAILHRRNLDPLHGHAVHFSVAEIGQQQDRPFWFRSYKVGDLVGKRRNFLRVATAEVDEQDFLTIVIDEPDALHKPPPQGSNGEFTAAKIGVKRSGIVTDMNRLLLLGLVLFSPLLFAADAKTVHVLFHTEIGDIEVEVDTTHAPVTASNFLRYVDKGFYDGGAFYRTVTMQNQPQNKVKIEVIQGGNQPRETEDLPPISLERTNKTGLKHVDGAISMARGAPDSATSEFFICVGEQPELDFGGQRNPDGQGFAAFGKVVNGMDVVKKIQQSPAEGQALKPEIKIVSAKRI